MYGKTIATPPGATIQEMLDDKKLSNTVFAFRMCMSLADAEALIQGKTRLTDRIASQLELVLGPPAKFWMNLKTIYRGKLTTQS